MPKQPPYTFIEVAKWDSVRVEGDHYVYTTRCFYECRVCPGLSGQRVPGHALGYIEVVKPRAQYRAHSSVPSVGDIPGMFPTRIAAADALLLLYGLEP